MLKMSRYPKGRILEPMRFKRRVVDVSGSKKITIPRPIVETYEYETDELVEIFAPDENRIVIERAKKRGIKPKPRDRPQRRRRHSGRH